MPGVKGRSGRKAKPQPPPPSRWPGGVADLPLRIEVKQIAELKCVKKARLPEKEIAELAERLREVAGYYSSTKDLVQKMPGNGRGRKVQHHKRILLHDCADAWRQATGKGNSGYVDAPSNQLTRIVLEAVGETKRRDLRRMGGAAAKWKKRPTEGEQKQAMNNARKRLTILDQLERVSPK